jgi:hypothetical protein
MIGPVSLVFFIASRSRQRPTTLAPGKRIFWMRTRSPSSIVNFARRSAGEIGSRVYRASAKR